MFPRMRSLASLAVLFVIYSPILAQDSSPQVPTRIRVSQGIAQRNILDQPEPEYPKEAIDKGLEGLVVLKFVIGREGHVQFIRASEGDSILAESAAKAVKQWRYKPFVLDGNVLEVETQVTIKFSRKKKKAKVVETRT